MRHAFEKSYGLYCTKNEARKRKEKEGIYAVRTLTTALVMQKWKIALVPKIHKKKKKKARTKLESGYINDFACCIQDIIFYEQE